MKDKQELLIEITNLIDTIDYLDKELPELGIDPELADSLRTLWFTLHNNKVCVFKVNAIVSRIYTKDPYIKDMTR